VSDSVVLCYHALSSTWDADLSIEPGLFERQIALLLRRGYRAVRFSEAVRSAGHGRVFAITFDDGYRSTVEVGMPILERLGVPATVFLPTDYIGASQAMAWPGIDRWVGGRFERELTPLSWDDARALSSAGWEIGSHTGSHPHLTRLDDTALQSELARSKAACEEHLSEACDSLAYPYGDVDARVIAATAEAGYTAAASLPRRRGSRTPLDWPRVGVYHRDDDLRFRMKVSPAVRRLRSSRAWNAVESLCPAAAGS
jgi:peptidoglycan/xylan/chitin deacetylase (PgdA/CDA1 family)